MSSNTQANKEAGNDLILDQKVINIINSAKEYHITFTDISEESFAIKRSSFEKIAKQIPDDTYKTYSIIQLVYLSSLEENTKLIQSFNSLLQRQAETTLSHQKGLFMILEANSIFIIQSKQN